MVGDGWAWDDDDDDDDEESFRAALKRPPRLEIVASGAEMLEGCDEVGDDEGRAGDNGDSGCLAITASAPDVI